jgi:O-antigen/teichoic acid export membrane protein
VVLMTLSSFLVPAAGLVTAPILARALSPEGRGEMAAALAPGALMLGAATLGLPDALTYLLAKRPRATRPALLLASLITVALGLVCFLATLHFLSFLSDGNPGLGRLTMLAVALTVPGLVVNVFRGAACGHQMWTAVAVERVINAAIKVGAFGILFLTGDLTVLAGVLVMCITAVVAGVVYLPLLRRPGEHADDPPAVEDTDDSAPLGEGILRPLLSFGIKVWLGSVAGMLLARSGQLLMAPLSSVRDLGLYSVATTVSDVPLIVALAIQNALLGVNSKTRDAARVTSTSRLTLLAAVAGCLVVGGTLPFWITPLFGPEFRPALVPTLMLLASALLCIPGLMAAIGLTAWGQPGLRSMGLVVTLVTNLVAFVVLVPVLGVYGACWTSLASNVVMTGFMLVAARRTLGVPARDFWLVRPADVRFAWGEGMRIAHHLLPARPR